MWLLGSHEGVYRVSRNDLFKIGRLAFFSFSLLYLFINTDDELSCAYLMHLSVFCPWGISTGIDSHIFLVFAAEMTSDDQPVNKTTEFFSNLGILHNFRHALKCKKEYASLLLSVHTKCSNSNGVTDRKFWLHCHSLIHWKVNVIRHICLAWLTRLIPFRL